MNGGKIISPNNFAIRMYANSARYSNYVEVNGGVIEGKRAIWLQLPGSASEEKITEINITGGILKSVDTQNNFAIYSYTFGDSFAKTKITISGGIFEGDVALTGGTKKTPTETIVVSGGTFNGEKGVYSYGEMAPFITGGTFKGDPTEYVDLENYVVTEVEGKFVVRKV